MLPIVSKLTLQYINETLNFWFSKLKLLIPLWREGVSLKYV